MNDHRVLELKVAVPGWYVPATAGLSLLVVVALLITPLRWPYTVSVLMFSAGVLWRVWREEEGRAGYVALQVHPSGSLALLDRDGSEYPAHCRGQPWITRWLIVLPLALPSRGTVRVVIARELNDRDAFRRFAVLCRYALSETGFAAVDAGRHNTPGSPTTGA